MTIQGLNAWVKAFGIKREHRKGKKDNQLSNCSALNLLVITGLPLWQW